MSFVGQPLRKNNSFIINSTIFQYLCIFNHWVKNVQILSYFWSVFSCIRTEYRKIRTRNNSAFGHFSRSDKYTIMEKINATRLRNQTKLKRIKKLDTSYRQKFWVLWPKFYFWKGDWALSLPNFQILLISPEAVTQRCS